MENLGAKILIVVGILFGGGFLIYGLTNLLRILGH